MLGGRDALPAGQCLQAPPPVLMLVFVRRAESVLSHHVCSLALQIQMKDFRFSYKFKMACKEDVLRLCPNIKKK